MLIHDLVRRRVWIVLLMLLAPGCKSRQSLMSVNWLPMGPSNDRDWSPDQAVLSRAEFQGDLVTVYNIRNCDYRTAGFSSSFPVPIRSR